MSRLADDIDFLQRAADTAGLVIYPGAGNVSFPAGGHVTASREALLSLGDELEVRRLRPSEYHLIDCEAVWLLKATHQLALFRADENAAKAERYQRFCEYLRAAVETDLANARKSMGEVA